MEPTDTWGPALNKHRKEANYPLLPDQPKLTSNGFNSTVSVKKQWKPPPKMNGSNGTTNLGYLNENGTNGSTNFTNYKKEPVVLGNKLDSVHWSRDKEAPLPYNFETCI